jgi:leucyl aminopeptidase
MNLMPSIRFSTRDAEKNTVSRTECAILPVASSGSLDASGKALDKDSQGLLRAALKAGEFNGGTGQTLLLHSTGDAARILLLGVGDGTRTRGPATDFHGTGKSPAQQQSNGRTASGHGAKAWQIGP